MMKESKKKELESKIEELKTKLEGVTERLGKLKKKSVLKKTKAYQEKDVTN
jgi:hypothetical protein